MDEEHPGNAFALYMCNARDPHHPQGAGEHSVVEDEDAAQFDFHGTIHHASFKCEVRQARRCLVHFVLKACSVMEIGSQSNSGTWPTRTSDCLGLRLVKLNRAGNCQRESE